MAPLKVSIIVAMVRETGGIGVNNSLPWRLSKDLEYFRAMTMGHNVVMGRRTWDSLPSKVRPLIGRTNIVLTRSPTKQADLNMIPNTRAKGSLHEALESLDDTKECFIIGGAQVYCEAICDERCTDIYATLIDRELECDTFFPIKLIPFYGFKVAHESDYKFESDIRYQYVHYKRAMRDSNCLSINHVNDDNTNHHDDRSINSPIHS